MPISIPDPAREKKKNPPRGRINYIFISGILSRINMIRKKKNSLETRFEREETGVGLKSRRSRRCLLFDMFKLTGQADCLLSKYDDKQGGSSLLLLTLLRGDLCWSP